MTESNTSEGRAAFGMRAGHTDERGDTDEQEDQKPDTLSEDATVDLAELRREAGIDDVLDTLDRELVGLAPVKTRIAEIAALLLVDRTRARFGLRTERPTLHMCFTGNPGTGKTTVALRMAELLHGLGYVRRGHLVSVTRDDLVGQYVGHTAPKTKEVIKRAMGGVLFIDEAYYLYREDNERDYGSEAIEILLQVMEANRDDLVVILAGYENRMDTFFAANPGMQSRIAHHLTFPDFTVDELEQIARLMTDTLGYRFSEDAAETFRGYLHKRVGRPWFAGARSVRNAVERARLRQARRLVEQDDPHVGLTALTTIEAADLLVSRVFTDESDGDTEESLDQASGDTEESPGESGDDNTEESPGESGDDATEETAGR